MKETRYFNAHSHRRSMSPEEWTCRNAFHLLSATSLEKLPYPVSVGVHPWHAGKTNLNWKEALRQLAFCKNVVAIGEAGLDKSRDVPWELQQAVWKFQFDLAQETGLPLIVHCVKSYYDFIPFIRQSRVPMAFHGFRGPVDFLSQISGFDGIYFSFGPDLLKNSHAQSLLQQVPDNRILLETDSGPTDIITIYDHAARILGIRHEDLCTRIKKNTSGFFGEKALTEF